MSFEESLTEFVAFLKSSKKATATIVAYRKDIGQLIEYLKKAGRANLKEVTTEDLSGFLALLSGQNYLAKSVSRKINSIKTFYRFLTLSRAIETNVAMSLVHPKFESPGPRILSRMEYRALRDAARDDDRAAAIVELLLQTGMRIGELAFLTLESVSENFIKIPAIEGHPERDVPLNKAAKDGINRYLAVRPKVKINALFVTKTGKPLLIRNIRTVLDRYFKIAGITGVKVNDLRHTFIAHHLAAGASPILIAKLVGHKRIATTEKYLEFIKDLPIEKTKLDEL
ncbi:tyrosine-type recombinase/integrase [Candidatus Gottesmanbacteria bacterium]|nr:tyrosine-type recombinase/integrase [Candidatus Gottesmanbacteria bacterium]